MKSRFNALLALIPIVNAVLLTLLLLILVKVETDVQKVDKNVEETQQLVGCEYFINVEEWREGTCMNLCTTVTSKSVKEIQKEFAKQTIEQLGSCKENGYCLDSCRLTLYRDCYDNYDIDVIRDTLIIF